MGDRGRLVIPAELRERAGLAAGSPVILVETPHGIVLMRRNQLRELVRADLKGLDLVNELLAERRRAGGRRGRRVNVFDSSALLAFVLDEPGADTVERELADGGVCGAVNWSEIAQRILAHGRNWDLTSALLRSYGLAVEPVVVGRRRVGGPTVATRRGALARRSAVPRGREPTRSDRVDGRHRVGRRRPDPADPLNGEDSMTTGPDAERALDAIADAEQYPYWYDDADEPDSNPTLVRAEHCDLCVVGGGYTGLWTAIIAKERDPSRDVVLIDAAEIGSAASGRNGGFMESTLTHGIANGQRRFPDEIELLERLGLENLDEIEAAIGRYGIDCDYERTGVIDVATSADATSYVDELRDDAEQLQRLGQDARWLDADAMRAEVDSPTYVGGLWRTGRAALVDPARLAWGLKAAAEQLGVRIYEDTKATEIDRDGSGTVVETPLAAGPGRPRRPRHQCLQAAAAPAPPLHRAGLRLLHGDRTADRGAARPHRLAQPPGALRHRQPVPLLPAHRGQPDPVGRLRRGVLLAGPGGDRAGEPAGHLGHAQPALLHHLPSARRRALQPHLGRGDRHVQPVLRLLGDGPVGTGRLRARGTPASAWRRAGSARR